MSNEAYGAIAFLVLFLVIYGTMLCRKHYSRQTSDLRNIFKRTKQFDETDIYNN